MTILLFPPQAVKPCPPGNPKNIPSAASNVAGLTPGPGKPGPYKGIKSSGYGTTEVMP
jgi:hypothetical protein